MTLNCIHIFIVTGSLLYWCVMRLASQRFFIHSCVYLRILIISYLATFLGTNSLSVLMYRKAVNQSLNSHYIIQVLLILRYFTYYKLILHFFINIRLVFHYIIQVQLTLNNNIYNTSALICGVLGMTLNCIHTEWCSGHDVKLHPHFHYHW